MTLTSSQVRKIRKLRLSGKTLKTIATRFKVSQPTINYHCKGIDAPTPIHTLTEAKLLKAIGKEITRKELLKKTGLQSPNMTTNLKKLEEKGLVSIVSEHQTIIRKM